MKDVMLNVDGNTPKRCDALFAYWLLLYETGWPFLYKGALSHFMASASSHHFVHFVGG